MKCPVCTTVNLVMSDRQGVEIDYCPECRGVWLDRGELDKVIERSALQETSLTPPPSKRLNRGIRRRSRYTNMAMGTLKVTAMDMATDMGINPTRKNPFWKNCLISHAFQP